MFAKQEVISVKLNNENEFMVESSFDFCNTNFKIKSIIDTGANHSLISINALCDEDKAERFKINLLCNTDVKIKTQSGIDNAGKNLSPKLSKDIRYIEKFRADIRNSDKSIEDLVAEFYSDVMPKLTGEFFNSTSVAYKVEVDNFKIGGLDIGNIEIMLGQQDKDVNLIGMSIIKKLIVELININSNYYLIAAIDAGNEDDILHGNESIRGQMVKLLRPELFNRDNVDINKILYKDKDKDELNAFTKIGNNFTYQDYLSYFLYRLIIEDYEDNEERAVIMWCIKRLRNLERLSTNTVRKAGKA